MITQANGRASVKFENGQELDVASEVIPKFVAGVASARPTPVARPETPTEKPPSAPVTSGPVKGSASPIRGQRPETPSAPTPETTQPREYIPESSGLVVTPEQIAVRNIARALKTGNSDAIAHA